MKEKKLKWIYPWIKTPGHGKANGFCRSSCVVSPLEKILDSISGKLFWWHLSINLYTLQNYVLSCWHASWLFIGGAWGFPKNMFIIGKMWTNSLAKNKTKNWTGVSFQLIFSKFHSFFLFLFFKTPLTTSKNAC